jgi:hypothetical protein
VVVSVSFRGEPVLLLGEDGRPDVSVGDGLHVRGVLKPAGVWASRLRMRAELRATSVTPSGRRRAGPAGALDGVRRRAQRALDQGLPAPQAGLLRGMVLGDDSALPRQCATTSVPAVCLTSWRRAART